MSSVFGRLAATMGAALLATVPLMSAIGTGPANAKPSQEMVAICHYDINGEEWELLLVKPKAAASHIKHGDAYPGDAVPGTDGMYIFDEYCVPQPVITGEKIYATAYTDMNPDDGDYNPNVDLLIAKVVEASGDSWLSSGDKIITHMYPKTFEPLAYGSFRTTEHVISAVLREGLPTVEVFSGTNHFVLSHYTTSEYYAEDKGSAESKSFWQDKIGEFYDEMRPNVNSPSWPTENWYVSSGDTDDDSFLDVWIAPTA